MHQIIHHWLLLSIFNSNDGNRTDQLHKQKFVGCRGLGILVGLELSRKLFLILWISLSCFKIQWGSNTHLFCSFNNICHYWLCPSSWSIFFSLLYICLTSSHFTDNFPLSAFKMLKCIIDFGPLFLCNLIQYHDCKYFPSMPDSKIPICEPKTFFGLQLLDLFEHLI